MALLLVAWKVVGREVFGWVLLFEALLLTIIDRPPGMLPGDLLLIGATFAVIAPPLYLATKVIGLDGDGGLDHLRLTPCPPQQLLRWLLIAALGPAAMLALLLLAAGTAAGAFDPRRLTGLAVAWCAAFGVSAAAMSVRWRGLSDVRVIRIGLLLASAIAATGVGSARLLEPPALLARIGETGFAWAALAGLALAAAGIPGTIRRLRRPLDVRRPVRRSASLMPWLLRWAPAPMIRSASSSIFPAAVLLIVAALIIRAAAFTAPGWGHDAIILTAVFLPLLGGGITISNEARADSASGRMEITSISSAGGAWLLAIAGAWLPFAAVWLALVSASPYGAAFALAVLPVVVGVAPLPIIEGVHRAPLAAYLAPASLIAVPLAANLATRLQAPSVLSARSVINALGLVLLASLPWAAARSVVANPSAPVLRGRAGLAAAGVLALGASLIALPPPMFWSIVILVVPFIGAGAPGGPWAVPLVVAGGVVVGTSVLLWLVGTWSGHPAAAAACGALAVVIGCRVHVLFRHRPTLSVAIRLMLAFTLILASMQIPLVVRDFWPRPSGAAAQRLPAIVAEYQRAESLVQAALLAVVAFAIEIAARLAAKARRRRIRE